ncbi:hypothetical protein K3X13_14545 [Aliiroseovarius crassostreae]|uniref:hypothetical protein n=1 Tax=Aliiroseovarius crassostreae TaxID=154981 RepID=UPI0021FBF300|nr:hypothetical protein [Aliiroseovarius crassostreae]UWP92213.1 hypothetical protein K3X13_14545 [Aliiroseovarius crassostreae]
MGKRNPPAPQSRLDRGHPERMRSGIVRFPLALDVSGKILRLIWQATESQTPQENYIPTANAENQIIPAENNKNHAKKRTLILICHSFCESGEP